MMPKVNMLAPDGVRGTIMGSQSGENYQIAEDGTVTVNHVDVAALQNGGFTTAPRVNGSAPERALDQPKVSSVAPGSMEMQTTAQQPQGVGDLGHSKVGGHVPAPETPVTELTRANAREEVDQRVRDGLDPAHVSMVPNTGHQNDQKPGPKEQAEARDPDAQKAREAAQNKAEADREMERDREDA